MGSPYRGFQGVLAPSAAPSGVTGWGGDILRPETTDRFQAMLGLQARERFAGLPTNLELAPRQLSHEHGAMSELRRSMAEFEQVGRLEDFYEYVDQEGKTGPIDRVLNAGSKTVSGAFDLLSVGNYTTAGFMQELLRTGSVGEAIKQAGVEFANALPMIEMEGARRPNFGQVFGENWEWGSTWYGAAAGFVADIVLDPLNFVPGVALTKGARAGAKLAGRAVPRGMKNAFGTLFRYHDDLLRLGAAGSKVDSMLDLSRARSARESLIWVDKIEQAFAGMHPHSRQLVALALDEPQFMERQFQEAVKAGIFGKEQYQLAVDALPRLKQFADDFLVGEPLQGLIDNSTFRYMPGRAPIDPLQQKLFAQADMGSGMPAASPRIPARRTFTPSMPKTYQSTYERLLGSFSGDIKDDAGRWLGTETDAQVLYQMRSVEHVRYVETKRLIHEVLNDPVIMAHAQPLNLKIANNPVKWNNYKKSLRQQYPGYDVLEVTRQKVTQNVNKKTGKKSTSVRSYVADAVVLPEPIVRYITRGDEILRNPGKVEQFLKYVGDSIGVWKGLATFGVGFHMRNATGMAWMNWVHGVGNSNPATLALRHAQAWKVQATAIGQGKVHGRVAKAIHSAVGKPVELIDIPNIRYGGKTLTAAEIMELAEKHNVVHGADMLFGVPEDVVKSTWNVGRSKEMMERIEGSGLDPIVKEAMKLPYRAAPSDSGRLARALGPKGTAMQEHRAVGHLIETNGRLTMFLDDLMKGVDPVEAGRNANKWHFDYRRLTEFEKRFMANLMPFYAWQRFSSPRIVMAMLEHPHRMAGMAKLHKSIRELHPEYQDLPTPDFYEEVMALQVGAVEGDKPLFMQIDFPLIQMNQMNLTDVRSSLNPAIKLMMETAPEQGVNFLTGAPIERFPGEEMEGVEEMPSFLRPSRKGEHVITNMIPVVGKSFRAARAVADKEGWNWLGTELTGVRFRSLDVRRVLRAQTFERRKLARDFKARLRQEGIDI